jgi:hypothetical protein
MTHMRKATTRVGVALIVAAAVLAATRGTSSAEPGAHQVKYTVTTQSDLTGQIYYLATEPPSKSAFDADSAQYLVRVSPQIVAGEPWVFETTLNDPTQWAVVSASGALRVAPQFHCEIAVDGITVVQQDGASGVQCALRAW